MQLFIVNSAAVLGLLGLASATAIGSAGARDEAAATAAIASSATSAGSYCVSVEQCLELRGRCGEQS